MNCIRGAWSIALAALFLLTIPQPTTQAQQASSAAIARRIGAIKAINGNTLTLSQDSGPDITATVAPNAVDVCSGVESAPGLKDHVALKQFISAVRAASARTRDTDSQANSHTVILSEAKDLGLFDK